MAIWEFDLPKINTSAFVWNKQIKEDWKYIALVLDRLFLWIFTTACTVGTLGIILQAPTIYDSREPVIERMAQHNTG